MRLLLGLTLLQSAWSCVIQGHDTGICRAITEVESEMPFCGSVVRYTSCVPREYSWFPNHTLAKKDLWAKQMYTTVLERRIAIERGRFPEMPEPWEAADGNAITRFYNNEDCMNAYKNFLCWLNFPRCDEQGETMMLCESVCVNFFRACKYTADMERCYEPAFYGGKEAESDALVDDNGLPIYLRAFFPGTPFRKNGFTLDGAPLPICTPSIRDSAGAAGLHLLAAALAALAVLAPVLSAV